jgi:hypothetical protein
MNVLLALLLLITPPFEWSKTRKLQWSDFQREYRGESVQGETCSGLEMAEDRDGHGGVVFTVNAVFHPELSFVSPDCSRSPYALEHEQLHFDITELYARQLRMALSVIQHTHKQSEADVAGDFFDIVKQAWAQEEDLYDKECNPSMNRAEQARWKIKIARQLIKLNNYAKQQSSP